MIESGIIKMPPKKMFSVLFIQNGIIWLFFAFIGILTFILLGVFWDPRFFMLALIWVFLISPMVMAFLYFFYGLKPLTTFNTIPHKLHFDDNKLTIKFYDENEKEMIYNPSKDYEVDKNLFQDIKTGTNYIILCFRNIGWLWLPVQGFNSMSEIQDVINMMKK